MTQPLVTQPSSDTCTNAAPCRCNGRCVDVRSDDFAGNAVDTCKFTVADFRGVSVGNGRLELNTAQDRIQAFIDSNCDLAGDYAVQVDFDVLRFPTQTGFVGLQLRDSQGSRAGDIYFQRYSDGDYFRLYVNDVFVNEVATSKTTGGLRLRKTGNVVDGLYSEGGGGWVVLGSGQNFSARPVTVGLTAASYGDDPVVRVAFDNYRATEGKPVNCRVGSCPA